MLVRFFAWSMLHSALCWSNAGQFTTPPVVGFPTRECVSLWHERVICFGDSLCHMECFFLGGASLNSLVCKRFSSSKVFPDHPNIFSDSGRPVSCSVTPSIVQKWLSGDRCECSLIAGVGFTSIIFITDPDHINQIYYWERPLFLKAIHIFNFADQNCFQLRHRLNVLAFVSLIEGTNVSSLAIILASRTSVSSISSNSYDVRLGAS